MFSMYHLAYSHMKMITVFSSLSIITGGNSQTASSIDIDFSVGDGQEFIKRIANGEKIPEHPGVLMFTAPYKLCDGGCKGSETNIALGFPLYIGKRGREAYKKIYLKDFKKIHHGNPQAPLKRKTTRAPFTRPSCSIVNINIISTVPTTTAPPTPKCPYIIPGTCIKFKKNKKNKSNTYHNSNDKQSGIVMYTHAIENNSAIKEESVRATYYTNDNNKFFYDSNINNVVYNTIVTPKIEKLKLYKYEKNIQVPDVQTSTAKELSMDVPLKQVIASEVHYSNVHDNIVHTPDTTITDITVPNIQVPDLQLSNAQNYQQLSETQDPSKQITEVKDSTVQVPEVQNPTIQDPSMQILNIQIKDVKLSDTPISLSPKQVPNMQILSEQARGDQLSGLHIPPETISDPKITLEQVPSVQTAEQIPLEQVPDKQIFDSQISHEQLLSKQIPPEKVSDTHLSNGQIFTQQVPDMHVSDSQISLKQVSDLQLADTRAPNGQFSHMQLLNEPVTDVKLSNTQDRHEQPLTEPVMNTEVPKLQIPSKKVSELRERQYIPNELLDKFVQYLRNRFS